MNKPFVSVIIVNWNGEKLLPGSLAALKNQAYSNFEVIVVDNGSTDNSIKMLEEKYPGFVKIIKNNKNLGFAEGNNIGIRSSQGEFIATLNNDAEPDAGWLEELINTVGINEKIGMCASKIHSFYNRDIIDSVGVNIYWDGMSRGRGRLRKDSGQFDSADVLIPSACAALYRKKMLDDIGIFDKDFFAYCEDTDLGLRGRLAGWECALAPKAVVYHRYSSTTGKYSLFKAFMVERNHLWVALKVFPIGLLIALPFFTVFRLLWQAISVIGYYRKNDSELEKISRVKLLFEILKAYSYVFLSITRILRKRREIWKKKRISNDAIYRWFGKFRLSVKELAID